MESNKRPREHKKSQPKIWRPEYQAKVKKWAIKKKWATESRLPARRI